MENPNFYLEGVVRDKNELQDFEGPLSLILMLLSKNKIEIRDIKIADILDQYLEYLAEMESMDLEIASEFVQMASHLLYIKTKMLLSGDEEEVSELEALMASLEQLKAKDAYSAIGQITPEFKKAAETGMLYFAKLPEPLPKSAREYEYRHEPVDLLRALSQVFARGVKTPEESIELPAYPKRITYSVHDKSREILNRLRNGSVSNLRGLYGQCSTRTELVATFISVLELCSAGSIELLRDGEDYVLRFVGGDIDEILENISNE